jgi:hypothetical protein
LPVNYLNSIIVIDFVIDARSRQKAQRTVTNKQNQRPLLMYIFSVPKLKHQRRRQMLKTQPFVDCTRACGPHAPNHSIHFCLFFFFFQNLFSWLLNQLHSGNVDPSRAELELRLGNANVLTAASVSLIFSVAQKAKSVAMAVLLPASLAATLTRSPPSSLRVPR